MRTNKRLAALAGGLVLVTIIAVLIATTASTAPKIHQHSVKTVSCQAGSADDTMPAAPPSDVTWKSIAAVPVPVSASYGPTRYRGALWTCYRHDPMGAVLAVYEITAAVISSDWHQVVAAQFVPGPGQQAFISQSELETLPAVQPDQVAAPVGFQVVSYTPRRATIDTLAEAGNGEYQVVQNTVAWSAGDWKILLSPDGSNGPDPQLVSSTDGFILWGGGNG
jgi:hypothetical protein